MNGVNSVRRYGRLDLELALLEPKIMGFAHRTKPCVKSDHASSSHEALQEEKFAEKTELPLRSKE
jgi:hypothetical protein